MPGRAGTLQPEEPQQSLLSRLSPTHATLFSPLAAQWGGVGGAAEGLLGDPSRRNFSFFEDASSNCCITHLGLHYIGRELMR